MSDALFIGLVMVCVLATPCLCFALWRKSRKLKAARRDLQIEAREKEASQSATKELIAKFEKLNSECAVLRKRLDECAEGEKRLEEFRHVTEDIGARNIQLKTENQKTREELSRAEGTIKYLENFAHRFSHDGVGRLELLRDILKNPTPTADEVGHAIEQLEFIKESLAVNLAPSISDHVHKAVAPKTVPFNLTKRITRLIDTFKNKGDRISITITDDDEIWLWGEWTHVELLVTNLVSNALNHGAGEVTVKLASDSGGTTQIVVENDGGPISQQLLSANGASPGAAQYGLFFIQQVVKGYEGEFRLDNGSVLRGSGARRQQTPRVIATVTLPIAYTAKRPPGTTS
jgi:signal transduction histidine kinase